ncbi:MAG: hypothetical protein AAGD07_16860 [Planctomycetota bacterium]
MISDEGKGGPDVGTPDEGENASRVPISKRLAVINAFSGLATHFVSFGVLLWANQYLLAHVPPHEMDLLPIVMGVVAFSPLLSVALTAGFGRFVVESYAKSDDRAISRLVSSATPIFLAVALIMVVVAAMICCYADRLLRVPVEYVADVRWMLGLVFLGIVYRLVANPFSVGLYVCQRHVLQNLILAIGAFMTAALMVVLMLGMGPRVKYFVMAQFVGTLFNVTCTVFVSCRLVPALRFRRKLIDFSCLKGVFTFNGWTFVRQVSASLRNGSVPFLLNALSAPGQATAFYIGSLADRQLQTLSVKLFSPLETPMIAMHAHGNEKGLANAYLRGGRLMLWFVMLVATPLAVLATECVNLYSHGNVPDAAVVLLISMLLFPIRSSNGMLGPLVHAQARPDLLARVILLTDLCVLCVSVMLILATGWGAAAVAVATGICVLVLHPLFWWRLGRKLAKVSFYDWMMQTFVPGMVPACVSACTLVLVKQARLIDTWAELFAAGAIGMTAYLIALLPSLRPIDRRDLADVWHSIRQRLIGPTTTAVAASDR